jgi:chromosome segregation ATPase
MPYLQNEKARLQAEIQAAAAEITNLTAQLQAQQQALAMAQSRLGAAQPRLVDAQARILALEAAAATADNRVAALNQQIDAHLANEPEQVIESPIPGRPPRPNPAWRRWKLELDRLTQQLDQAQADGAAAHVGLNDGRARVSQATAEVQATERQVAEATDAVQVTQLAIATARQRQETAQAQRANLDRWNEEIARDPLARKTLEQVAAELSDRAAALEEAHAVARVQNAIAEETLLSLTARRDQLTPALNGVNAQLPAASEELRAANVALSGVTRSIQMHLRRGPRA